MVIAAGAQSFNPVILWLTVDVMISILPRYTVSHKDDFAVAYGKKKVLQISLVEMLGDLDAERKVHRHDIGTTTQVV
jgi:hypothetical protein